MSVYTISNQKVDQVIDDLLLKFPKGEKGKLSKTDYGTEWDWRPSTSQYTHIITCNEPYWGWSAETLYRVHYKILQGGSLRSFIRSRDENASSKAISRRENRLQDRLYDAKRNWERSTGDAIWTVRVGHGVEVHVISSSEKSAEMLGKTVAAGAGMYASSEKLWTRKAAPADDKILKELRLRQVKSITEAVKRNAEKIEELKRKSASLMEMCVSLQEFNSFVEGE